MSAITLQNAYQAMGHPTSGLTTIQALTEAGMTGWNQRLVEPMIYDGLDLIESDYRFNVADLPVGEGGAPKKVVLGSVLKSYRPIQVEEAFVPLIDTFDQGGLTVETVGAYDSGRAAFACFSLPDAVLSGEQINGYLTATLRNDGSGAVRVLASRFVVRCANQLTGLARKGRPMLSTRHTKNADPFAMRQVEVLLGLTTEWDRALAEEIHRLQEITVTKQQYVAKVVPAVLGMDRPEEKGRSQTIFDRKFDELVAVWSSPFAAEGNTGWHAYNAITEWEQHHRSTNQRTMAEALIAERQPATARALAVLLG